jgi:protein-tyrosine kinase
MKLSLIERAAARLDLRVLAMPGPIAAAQASESPRVAEAVRSPTNGWALENNNAAAVVARRTPARAGQVLFDPVRLREIGLVNWAAGRTRVVEEFRIVKRQLLQYAQENAEGGQRRRNLVMITSAWPREGRTFTALNLAISIAMEPNRRVLLVDACDNENSIRSILRETSVCGWRDLMTDRTLHVGDALLETEIPRLSVMLAGGQPKYGAELLASEQMQRLLEGLSDRDDDRIVLIDAPPCLTSSDPATLAQVVRQTVLVVEAATTQQQNVETAMELLRPCRSIYLVLNKNRFQ